MYAGNGLQNSTAPRKVSLAVWIGLLGVLAIFSAYQHHRTGTLSSTPTPTATAATAAYTPIPVAGNLLGLLQANSDTSQFADLLAKSGLEGFGQSAMGDGITILAPTNAALATLPAGMLDRLRKPTGKVELDAFMNDYLLAQSYQLSDLVSASTVETLVGDSFPVSQGSGNPLVGKAQLTGQVLNGSNARALITSSLVK